VETAMNGDSLDPGPGINWWDYGYIDPPSVTKDYPYVRHGRGVRQSRHSVVAVERQLRADHTRP